MNPGTNTSFDALKQVDAGHLNVGYAGLAEGEPHYDDLEARLAKLPAIAMPTITLEGDANGAPHPDSSAYAGKFSGKYAHRTISGGAGHNLLQEAPQDFAQAIVDVDGF